MNIEKRCLLALMAGVVTGTVALWFVHPWGTFPAAVAGFVGTFWLLGGKEVGNER